jgi:hypothetical protein
VNGFGLPRFFFSFPFFFRDSETGYNHTSPQGWDGPSLSFSLFLFLFFILDFFFSPATFQFFSHSSSSLFFPLSSAQVLLLLALAGRKLRIFLLISPIYSSRPKITTRNLFDASYHIAYALARRRRVHSTLDE